MGRKFKRRLKRFGKRISRIGTRMDQVGKMVTGKEFRDGVSAAYSLGGNVTSALVKGYRTIKDLINVEPKFVDVSTNQVPTTTEVVSYLQPLSQGTSDTTRIGQKILLKDIYIRATASWNVLAGNTHLRWALVFDKENRGANPAWLDIFQTASTLSPIDEDNGKRFVIVRTGMVNLNLYKPRVSFKIYKKFNSIHSEYNGNAGTVADARENNLFFVSISNEGTNGPSLTIYTRVKFYDN